MNGSFISKTPSTFLSYITFLAIAHSGQLRADFVTCYLNSVGMRQIHDLVRSNGETPAYRHLHHSSSPCTHDLVASSANDTHHNAGGK